MLLLIFAGYNLKGRQPDFHYAVATGSEGNVVGRLSPAACRCGCGFRNPLIKRYS